MVLEQSRFAVKFSRQVRCNWKANACSGVKALANEEISHKFGMLLGRDGLVAYASRHFVDRVGHVEGEAVGVVLGVGLGVHSHDVLGSRWSERKVR